MASVGLAFSGGGVTGLLAQMCIWNALNSSVPGFDSDAALRVSTTSGGTIGYGLTVNTGETCYFPPYDPTATVADLEEKPTGDRSVWFAELINYIPDVGEEVKRGVADRMSAGVEWPIEAGWWIDAIDAAFWLPYGVHDYDIVSGDRSWIINYGVLAEDACPITSRIKSNGIYKDAEDNLMLVSYQATNSSATTPTGMTFKSTASLLDALAYSSAFWVASIVESRAQYLLLSGSLMSDKATALDGSEADYIFTDGGFVDTTGIVSLLQQKTDTIVAFYSNNNDLVSLNSTIAYLFGVSVATDTMNSLQGPSLGQVFDSTLYPDVIQNLTDQSVLRARLENVQVSENTYLGVPAYELGSLFIMSNQYSQDFLDSFDNTDDISSSLDADFPASFAVSMPTLDANALCMMKDWQIQLHRDELSDLILPERRR